MAGDNQTLSITVISDNLLVGDLRILERAQQGEIEADELIEFLDRVIDGDVEKLPLVPATQALNEFVSGSANPESAEGN